MNTFRQINPANYIYLILILMVFAVCGTFIFTFLATTPPRNIIVWSTTGLFVFIEFIVSMIVINVFCRHRCKYKPSGSILIIVGWIIAVYFIISALTIMIYAGFKNISDNGDYIFSGIMVAETVLFSIVSVYIYSHNIFSQQFEHAISENRNSYKELGHIIENVINQLNTLHLNEPTQLAKLSALQKTLRFVEVSLTHTNSRGLRTLKKHSEQIESEISYHNLQQLTQEIVLLVNTVLPNQESTLFDEQIAKLDELAQRMVITVRTYNLS